MVVCRLDLKFYVVEGLCLDVTADVTVVERFLPMDSPSNVFMTPGLALIAPRSVETADRLSP